MSWLTISAMTRDAVPIGINDLRPLAGAMFMALERSGLALLIVAADAPDHPIVFANAAFSQLTGYSAEEVAGRNCRLLQGPDTDRPTLDRIRDAIRAGRPVEAQILNYRKDGTSFWNNLNIMPVTDDAGSLAYFVATLSDVTSAHVPGAAWRHEHDRRMEATNAALQATLGMPGTAGAWDWRIKDRRLFGDPRFAALHGLAADDLAKGVDTAAFFSAIHPQDKARIRLAVGGMLQGAEVFAKEFRLLAAEGAVRWVQARGRCEFDEAEQPTRFVGALVDITEQKRVEEQLRIAQTAGEVGAFEYVDGFATVSVSPQFCRLLGLQPARNLPLSTLNALVLPPHPLIVDPAARPMPGPAEQLEFEIIRPDTGEARWLTRRGEFIRDADWSGLRFVGVIYDVTAAKRTEAALRTLNETLETQVAMRTAERDRLWEFSEDLLVVAEHDGFMLRVNPSWHRLLGHEEAGLLRTRFIDLVHPDDRSVMTGALERMRAASQPARVECRLTAADGSWRWIAWTLAPEPGSRRLSGVGRDGTAERAQAAALRQAEDALRQSQKMEAVGQLTGGIAHDFNNLLAGITGSLELIRTRVAQGRLADADRYVVAAQGAAKRAASLTHRLLAFSRRQTLDPKPVDSNRLIHGMEELIGRTVGPAIDLQVVEEADLWTTLVDPNQLENALLNLCINARDAMPDGGRLTIETGNVTLAAEAVWDWDLPPGDYVRLAVTDTGTGMPPSVVKRAFDPFFTTKPLGVGTGLGLSMIYGFTRQSGGQVRIESEVGVGTRMQIYLPRHHGTASHGEPSAEGSVTHRANGDQTVLVVDDEPTVRMLVADVLRDLGYVVIEAEDGPAGLKVLRSAAGISLLITDIGLPGGMNGRQVADMGRGMRPDLKVLYITGYTENVTIDASLLEFGTQILVKPFSVDAFVRKISSMLGGP